MLAFVSIAGALVLLSSIIFALHRYQSREVRFNAARSMPLPPLEAATDDSGIDKSAYTNGHPDSATSTRTTAAAASSSRLKPDNWLARVNELKKRGQLDRALELCTREFPLWSAYNQACILYRAKIKQAEDAGEAVETLLRTLYRTAAQAEMLHEVTAGSAKLRLEQLRRLDLSRLSDLEFPYQDIGYTQLRLVRKHDIRMMQGLWGRPRQHSTPRQLHETTWKAMRTAIT